MRLDIDLLNTEILWIKCKCMDCMKTYEVTGWEIFKGYINKYECPHCKASKQLGLSEEGRE